MRQIKFRGKCIKTGEWFYGSLAYFPDSQTAHIIPCGTCKGDEVICDFIEVDPNTVNQNTGLCDVNDAEIYEGDIIAIRANPTGSQTSKTTVLTYSEMLIQTDSRPRWHQR